MRKRTKRANVGSQAVYLDEDQAAALAVAEAQPSRSQGSSSSSLPPAGPAALDRKVGDWTPPNALTVERSLSPCSPALEEKEDYDEASGWTKDGWVLQPTDHGVAPSTPPHEHSPSPATGPPSQPRDHGASDAPLDDLAPPAALASDARRCCWNGFGCSFASTQLQRWVDHVNLHRGDLDDDGALWAELVLQAGQDVCWCPCGMIVPNTAAGARKHTSVCDKAGEELAARNMVGDNSSPYPGALAGLLVQVFEAQARDNGFDIGSLVLTTEDHGSVASPHRLACFYLSCTGGDTRRAVYLKLQLAGPATSFSRARKPSSWTNFGDLARMAEEEVHLAHALLVGPLCVLDTTSGRAQATLVTSPKFPDGQVTFVSYDPGHYRQLTIAPTTVARLRAAAISVGAPKAGLIAARARPALAGMPKKKRGRPKLDTSAPARPRLPDPPAKPPVAPPRGPGLYVDFDGGARGNPGIGGSGALLLLVRGGSCSVLARRSDFLGARATNNFAEFSGLTSGLQLALDFITQSQEPVLGLCVTATGDSELVIQAMLARREIRNPALLALAAQADLLCEQLEALGCTVDFKHVRRALNGEADKLANEAMDSKSARMTHTGDFPAARSRLPLPAPDKADELVEPSPAERTGRIPLLTGALPSREQLHAWLAEVHKDSRVLSRLLPSKLWPVQTTLAWTAACARFTPRLAAALDSKSELELTQALLDLIELPSLVLREHCPGLRPEDVRRALAGDASAAAAARGSPPDEHPDPLSTALGGDPRTRRAERQAYMDRGDRAMQEVLSNGCAIPTQDSLNILRSMHPAGRGTSHHRPAGPQVKITTKQAQSRLFSLAGNAHSPSDCFGWSACLLYPLRGKKKLGRHIPFIHQVARLVARIASAQVPSIFADIITCGNLFALHKLDASEQAAAAALGLPPSLRPVNTGCNLLKWGLQLAVRSPEAQAAARALEPLQSGLAKRGPEAFCHSLRALREQGHAVLKTDFVNGFNAISRQAVLDAVQLRCPQLTSLFNLFYTVDGACFYIVGGVVEVIWSAEGVRMGCPLGSFGFDLALQGPLERCAQRNPGKVVRSLTDDCNLTAPLPSVLELRAMLAELEADAKQSLNLDLNLTKCALLLPPAHSLLPEDLVCFEGIKLPARGMRVAGAPIGDDDYCAEFVGIKVDAALAKCRALRGIHPQVGMLLLRKCCVVALNYLSQVVPPSLTEGHSARFDEELAVLVLELLTLPGRPASLTCAEDRLSAFRRRLRLPTRFNGAGLLGIDGVGPAAFVGSVIASCEVDPVLANNIAGLERFAAPAVRLLQARLAQLGNERVNATLRLPLVSPVDLFSPARYVEQNSDTKRAPKMQQTWAKEIHAAAAHRLRPLEAALGDCDFVASQARAKPVGPILNLRLSNPFNRFTPAQFVAWFRFQFRIPQLARLGNAGADGVEQCLGSCSKRTVDLHGNHANKGCLATLAARGSRHSRLKDVVSFHGAKAGCVVSWVKEETTPELLLHQFTLEQCQTMFPKRAKVKLAAQARLLERELRAATLLAPSEREIKQRELGEQLDTLLDLVKDGKGLRLDGTVTHLASGEQIWYDTTTVHTTCSTKIAAELTLTRKRQAAGKEGKHMQSAGLMAVHQTKLDRYALLAALVERQVLDGLRTAPPTILPVAVSTHGELCPGAVRMQEWLVGKYRARVLLEGDRDDGEKPETLTANFRRDFRSSLLVASCKGLADMLLSAGMPFACKRTHGGGSVGGSVLASLPSPKPLPSRPRPPRGRDLDQTDSSADDSSTASSSDDSDDSVGGRAGRGSRPSPPRRRSSRLARIAATPAGEGSARDALISSASDGSNISTSTTNNAQTGSCNSSGNVDMTIVQSSG